MRLIIKLLALVFCFTSCNEGPDRKTELEKTKPEIQSIEDAWLAKVPDSLELIAGKNLTGDFNGDNKADITSLVVNKINMKTGVLIIHDSKQQESYVFGAGNEVDHMTDLDWIQVFEILPKGEIISPILVDERTGDIVGADPDQSFRLIGNGIYMGVEESGGGGILFWDGNEYNWYHIE